MKRSFLSIFLFFLCFQVFGQTIKIKLNNHQDTTVFLIKYQGKRLYYADTADLQKGYVQFDGKKQKPGILALLLPGQKYFEFIYNNEDVVLETTYPDFIKTMKVKKSEENKVFIPYVNFITEKKTKSAQLSTQLNSFQKGSEEYASTNEQIDKINKSVVAYQKNLCELNPSNLVGRIVKMGMDIEVPDFPEDSTEEVSSAQKRFEYYRDHYWDNVDFSFDPLVNNPVFHNKLETFFSKNMMVQHWDTVIKYAFKFIDRLDPKSSMFEYCVGWITSTYGKSEIMGMDKVYLYMLNKYYCSKNEEGKSPAFWVKEDKLEEICENLNNKINLVVGVRPPNLILKDTSDNQWVDFYSLKSDYTILYFWDPECGHCKKTTPKLGRLYKEKLKERNVEVYAIGKAIGKDFEAWKKFIVDNDLTFINAAVTDKLYQLAKSDPNSLVPVPGDFRPKPTTLESLNYQTTYDIFSTPVAYILDKDKNIIAKRVSISQIEDMLDHLQNMKDAPKLFPPNKEEDEQMQMKH